MSLLRYIFIIVFGKHEFLLVWLDYTLVGLIDLNISFAFIIQKAVIAVLWSIQQEEFERSCTLFSTYETFHAGSRQCSNMPPTPEIVLRLFGFIVSTWKNILILLLETYTGYNSYYLISGSLFVTHWEIKICLQRFQHLWKSSGRKSWSSLPEYDFTY